LVAVDIFGSHLDHFFHSSSFINEPFIKGLEVSFLPGTNAKLQCKRENCHGEKRQWVDFTKLFTRTVCADILAPKISNPKHSFVIFGTKIWAQNAHVKC